MFINRVQQGQPMRLPAAAYNAFVETSLRDAERRRNIEREDQSRPLEPGMILVLAHETTPLVKPFHALVLTEPVFNPEMASDSSDSSSGGSSLTPNWIYRFQQKRAMVGLTPYLEYGSATLDYQLPTQVAISQGYIKPGKIGPCMMMGITLARVHVHDERDRTCDIEYASTVLRSLPLGGYPILWKESGLGDKWAVIQLGTRSSPFITAAVGRGVVKGDTNDARWVYPWSETRIEGNPDSPINYQHYITGFPAGLDSKEFESDTESAERQALNRYDRIYLTAGGSGGNTTLIGLGPNCDYGAEHECPPANPLHTRIVPVPKGTMVVMACERDTRGNPNWRFSAMNALQVHDGVRQLNLYMPVNNV